MEYFIAVIIILALIIIATFILSTVWLKTRHYKIQTNKLQSNGDDLRITFISDLHERKFGKKNARLIEKIRETLPDIIVIGGDVVDTYGQFGGDYEYVFHALPKIAPTYLVLGNHEYSAYRETEIIGVAQNAGIHFLGDTAEEIEFSGNIINIIGLSDYKKDNIICQTLAETIQQMPIIDFENRLNILICHRPTELEAIAETGIDIMLSGHMHGGQMRLPFVGAVFTPSTWRLFPKYASGHYGIGKMDLVVSSGLGASTIPLRFNNRPEITVIDITEK